MITEVLFVRLGSGIGKAKGTVVKPTMAAAQLRGSLTQYLTTTYALADEGTRRALERFLEHPETGIFRGPYLRIRTPFHVADDSWQRELEWTAGFPASPRTGTRPGHGRGCPRCTARPGRRW
ncbi:hypothetical protein RGF97_06035 [Streptomyces roseicoloratus]|uniref:Uncharacterized protein n=1 Tax=Streptomyces roseicoloratus TaxID=2508722 RepID=A0ABY9RQM9_9ACTN|nr:hypothetical protein [Streptomyces roseicoloratus]WMX44508.1 hypothetical protein RGF97_06035 [Streptomyces roseicoloratus]